MAAGRSPTSVCSHSVRSLIAARPVDAQYRTLFPFQSDPAPVPPHHQTTKSGRLSSMVVGSASMKGTQTSGTYWSSAWGDGTQAGSATTPTSKPMRRPTSTICRLASAGTESPITRTRGFTVELVAPASSEGSVMGASASSDGATGWATTTPVVSAVTITTIAAIHDVGFMSRWRIGCSTIVYDTAATMIVNTNTRMKRTHRDSSSKARAIGRWNK